MPKSRDWVACQRLSFCARGFLEIGMISLKMNYMSGKVEHFKDKYIL